MKIEFKKSNKNVHTPRRAHPEDVGYDVYADGGVKYNEEYNLYMIDTGLAIKPEEGYFVDLRPNSRLIKSDFYYFVGLIDPNYRGNMMVYLKRVKENINDFSKKYFEDIVNCVQPIGQLEIKKKIDVEWIEVDSLDETDRGEGGFGSTTRKE